jgi:hypothetical protein
MIRKPNRNSIRSQLPSKSGKKRIRIHSPHLHSGQLDIIERRRRFNVVVCGRRFGKTVLIRSKHLIARTATKRLKVGIFAPEFKDISETWEKICKTLKPISTSLDNTKKRMILKNGSSIEFWSLANERKRNSGRGRDYDILIYEETQSINANILEYHWQKVGRPTLSDREGEAWFFGTPPNTKKHFFYTLICRGAFNNPDVDGGDIIRSMDGSGYEDYITFRKSSYTNPHIKDSEIDAAKGELPLLIFEQEYLAICVEYAESPFLIALQDAKVQKRVFVQGLRVNWSLPVWISFDFNKNPMSAAIYQMGEKYSFIHCIKDFGAPKGQKVSIHYTCNLIREFIYKETGLRIGMWDGKKHKKPTHLKIRITGDATGNTNDSRQLNGLTYYQIIVEELGLKANHSLRLFRRNPPHSESFLHCNTWIAQHPRFFVDEVECSRLRYDMLNAQATGERRIDKKKYDPHYLDTLRYFLEAATPRKYAGYGK